MRFPENLFVDFVGPLVDAGGWTALAAPFQDPCKTLNEWVRNAHENEAVTKVFENLFLKGGLSDIYSRAGRGKGERSISRLFADALPLYRRARIQKAMQDLSELTGAYDPMKWFRWEIADNFLRARQVDELPEESFPMEVSRCLSHGDLHGRNILVRELQAPRAVLIDPANVGILHWALDLARLTADLVVSEIDVGRMSHEWTHMNAWQQVVGGVIRGEPIKMQTESGKNAGLFAALNWISANWQDIYLFTDGSRAPRWEFVLALACEFLRASYRDHELPGPKRVLALTAGCEALREVAREFKKLQR